jgi:hypothetical protein
VNEKHILIRYLVFFDFVSANLRRVEMTEIDNLVSLSPEYKCFRDVMVHMLAFQQQRGTSGALSRPNRPQTWEKMVEALIDHVKAFLKAEFPFPVEVRKEDVGRAVNALQGQLNSQQVMFKR